MTEWKREVLTPTGKWIVCHDLDEFTRVRAWADWLRQSARARLIAEKTRRELAARRWSDIPERAR